MATSNQIIAAANDPELQERIVALAAKRGIPTPRESVQTRLMEIVAKDIEGTGASASSIATVYEYAAVTFKPAPRPGSNPAAVTDEQIEKALQALWPVTP